MKGQEPDPPTKATLWLPSEGMNLCYELTAEFSVQPCVYFVVKEILILTKVIPHIYAVVHENNIQHNYKV